MLFSNHATPVGWRFMSGYGCHTFRWVNREGKYVFIKVRSLPPGIERTSIENASSTTGSPVKASNASTMTRRL
jgi:catalase